MKGTSIFAQITNSILPRHEFQRIVKKHQGDKHSKGMTCWEQFVSMLFLHLSKVTSIREIVGGMQCATGKLLHLGLNKVHPKSTLSYANAHRPWQIYQDVFYAVLDRCRSTLHTGKKFKFKNKLLSMDSTMIFLCLSLFPWAKYRQTKGAVKLHLLLDHDGYFPVFAVASDGKSSDIPVAKKNVLPNPALVPAGSIIVFDRGYVDLDIFAELCRRGVYFVTRVKNRMLWEVVEERKIPPHAKNILRDALIVFTSDAARKLFGQQTFRIVESLDPDTGNSIEILTNHLTFAATTIARIYKDRWSIENFFKEIKTHLKIKTFVGTTENALLIQIWTALITILAIKYLKALSTFRWSFSNLVTILRLSLFTYRDLTDWLHNPFATPPWDPSMQIEIDYG